MAEHQNLGDADARKGAVEGDRNSNTSMTGQNPHRTSDPNVKANDSDFPEPGSSPEHSGERQGFTRDRHGRPHQNTEVAHGSTLSHEKKGARNRNSDIKGARNPAEETESPAEGADVKARRSPEREQVDQDPGHKQKQMHNDEKDDPLAA
ncbi:MAG: hypothetical protein ACRD3E_05910 [Terriglobales bacterium]